MVSALAARFCSLLTAAASEPRSPWDHTVLEAVKLELRAAASDGTAATVLREVVEQISQPAEFWVRAVDFISLHVDSIGGQGPHITQLLVVELLRYRKALRVPLFQAADDRFLFNVDRVL